MVATARLCGIAMICLARTLDTKFHMVGSGCVGNDSGVAAASDLGARMGSASAFDLAARRGLIHYGATSELWTLGPPSAESNTCNFAPLTCAASASAVWLV